MDNSILSMTFGRAGHGMSVFSEGAEASPGLSLEQKEKRRIEKEKTRLEDARRLEAVCEAFLKFTPLDRSDHRFLQSLLERVVEKPSKAQIQAFFKMLPPHTVGRAIAWGVEDTCVRHDILEFFQDQQTAIAQRVRALSG